MIRTLILSLATALAASPALAADVHIKIAGKDDATLQRNIQLAARQVCRAALPGRLTLAGQSCIHDAVRDAQGQLVQARAAAELHLAQVK